MGHYRTMRHRGWREETYGETTPQGGCTPTAGPERVDVSAVPPVRSVPVLRLAGGAR